MAPVHDSAAALCLPPSSHRLHIAVVERLAVAAVQLKPIVSTLVAERSRSGVTGASRTTQKIARSDSGRSSATISPLRRPLLRHRWQQRKHQVRSSNRGGFPALLHRLIHNCIGGTPYSSFALVSQHNRLLPSWSLLLLQQLMPPAAQHRVVVGAAANVLDPRHNCWMAIGAPRPRAGACRIRLLPADEHLHVCCDIVLQP